MFTLRPYQEQASSAGIKFLNGGGARNAVIVVPTGGGKSLIIADIVNNLQGNTIVFQPTKELLEQNFMKFLSYGNNATIFSASKGSKQISPVTYATIGSVIKHSHRFRSFDHCIIDECHLVNPNGESMYQKFFKETGLNNLGFTATPIRLKNYSGRDGEKFSQLNMLNRSRPKSYHEYIHVTQVADLAAEGYFAPIQYRINHEFRKDLLRSNTTGAEYTDESISRAYQLSNINSILIGYINKTKRRHVLIFCKSIADAQAIQDATGVPMVTGKTPPKERERIIGDFKAGKTRFVLNVGVLTTGFDFPALDTIVLARPTLSLALYYQMIGRGVRPFKTKDRCVVVDIVNNYERFGKVEDITMEQRSDGWCLSSKGKVLTGTPMYN